MNALWEMGLIGNVFCSNDGEVLYFDNQPGTRLSIYSPENGLSEYEMSVPDLYNHGGHSLMSSDGRTYIAGSAFDPGNQLFGNATRGCGHQGCVSRDSGSRSAGRMQCQQISSSERRLRAGLPTIPAMLFMCSIRVNTASGIETFMSGLTTRPRPGHRSRRHRAARWYIQDGAEEPMSGSKHDRTSRGALRSVLTRTFGTIRGPILRLAALFVLAGCTASQSAQAMSVRDILYLNKYGKDISGVSWCSDRAVTFIAHGPAHSTVFPPEYSRDTAVSMFTIETERIRPIIMSEHAGFGVDCVRNGDFVFLSGSLYTAMSTVARSSAQERFSQFIDVRPRDGLEHATRVLRMGDFSLRSPLRTASDGSVYGEAWGHAPDLDSVAPSKRTAVIKGETYSLTRDGVRTTLATIDYGNGKPAPFAVYAFSAQEAWGIGSYDCPASRPGCTADASGPRVGYYVYSKVNANRARLDLVHTMTPGREPLVRRWPVVAGPGISSNTLLVSGVALDAKHCYVLLEPNSALAVNRINGHLRLDLYLAQCRFTANRLEFNQPSIVGKKQASFVVPGLSLHGEFVVIAETTDLASQVDDQIEFERAAIDRPNVCARFYRAGPWPVAPVNNICVRLIQDGAEGLMVSPDGGYVDIRSKGNPLIVGREYRNDGTGPAWLNHGEQP